MEEEPCWRKHVTGYEDDFENFYQKALLCCKLSLISYSNSNLDNSSAKSYVDTRLPVPEIPQWDEDSMISGGRDVM